MKIYFIRHGETDYNKNGKIQGSIDIPLNAKGKEQATKAADVFQPIPVEKIYYSPLQRAKETMELAFANRDIPSQVEPRIVERHYGDYEGKVLADLKEKGYSYRRSYTEDDYTMFGIETLGSMKDRLHSFLADLKAENLEHVALVSHGGLGRVLVHLLTKESHENLVDYAIKNCEILEFEVKE